MKASQKAASIGGGIARGVEIHGDKVWEIICDEMPINVPFSREDVCDKVAAELRISRRYARDITQGVLKSVQEQSGTEVLRRVGNRWVI